MVYQKVLNLYVMVLYIVCIALCVISNCQELHKNQTNADDC